ncbi:hypothetical protein HK100_007697, partial [Physocladia obscura]
MFYDIPKGVVKGIYQARLQKMIDGIDRSGSDSDDELELLHIKGLNSTESVAEPVSNDKNKKIGEDFTAIANGLWKYMFDTHHMGFRSLILCFVSMGYFIGSGIPVLAFISAASGTGNVLFWSGQRLAMLKQSTFWTREGYIALATNTTKYPTIYFPTSNLSATDMLNNLEWLEDGVMYGSTMMDITPITKMTFTDAQVQLSLNNACVSDSPSDCSTYWSGLMTRGLHAVISKYILQASLILNMVQQVNAQSGGPTAAQISYIDGLVAQLRQLDIQYLTPSLVASMNLFSQPVADSANSFYSLHLGVTVCFVIAA